MPTVVQFRRGTTAQNNAFTGAAGEISVDTTLGTIRVHNGTVGGNILASIDAVQTLSNKTLATPTVTGTLTSTGLINTSGNISAAILNSGAINSTGLINTTGNIVCASISAGTYVGLSSNKINTNASNVTVDTSWVNVAVNGSNVAALGAESQLNLLSTAATSSSTGALVVTGGVGIGGSLFVGSGLTVAGNLTINGNLTTINSNNLTVNDSIIYLAEENPADTLDIGITAHVVNPTLNHVGFVRDATDSTWKLFANVATQPSGTVDFTNATWSTLQTGNHVPGSSNVFTLGSTTAWWQKAFTVSATAQYADLAENYTSDSDYAPGTVLVFGGEAEVTQSATSHDTRIAGVVSTNPAYLMNGAEPGIAVALQGRVPCRVLGPVAKGDRLVASQHPGIAQKLNPDLYEPGCIIGKALQAIDSTDISIIEVVVGRL
jgi:hypothetical protein